MYIYMLMHFFCQNIIMLRMLILPTLSISQRAYQRDSQQVTFVVEVLGYGPCCFRSELHESLGESRETKPNRTWIESINDWSAISSKYLLRGVVAFAIGRRRLLRSADCQEHTISYFVLLSTVIVSAGSFSQTNIFPKHKETMQLILSSA